MKVLHVSATDAGSGAAIAAYRFHAALRNCTDIESKMLVATKRTQDDDVIVIYDTFSKRLWLRIRKYLDRILSGLIFKSDEVEQRLSLCIIPYSLITEKINKINPDIVYFHWIHDGIFYIKDILNIPYPVFCTMHDTWYASLGQYIKNENNIDSYADNYFFKLKKKIYNKKKPIYLTVSTWMEELAKKSSLLYNQQVTTIHDCIDTNFFKPIPTNIAKNTINITAEKIVLFGASNFSRNKGEQFIEQICDYFENRQDVVFVFIGRKFNVIKKNVIQTGNLSDAYSLILYYSAAHVLVAPSFQESFGLVMAESMACGTPVVAFNATGPKDIIDHKINGYLAQPFEVSDLISGIEWILDNENYNQISENAVEKIKKSFSYPVIAKKLLILFKKSLVNNQNI